MRYTITVRYGPSALHADIDVASIADQHGARNRTAGPEIVDGQPTGQQTATAMFDTADTRDDCLADLRYWFEGWDDVTITTGSVP